MRAAAQTGSVSVFRRAGRRTNLALLVLLGLTLATGALAFAIGTPRPARVVAVTHGAAGLALVLLVPWKSVIARRGLRRPRSGTAGILLALLVLATIVSGLVHSLGDFRTYLGVTPMQVHVGAALVAVPFFVFHLRAHPPRLRRADLSRRAALRALALSAGAGLVYVALVGVAAAARLPGRSRRATGSHEVGSGVPQEMPVTQWFTDSVPAVDRASWRLELVAEGAVRRLTVDELAAGRDVVRATLDCTGGWYADQEWRGIRLDRLLPTGVLQAGGRRCIEVVSVTGYGRRLPLSDAAHLLLATHAAGEELSSGHGAPARLVAPGRRGFWWVKWVRRVEVLDEPWWWQFPFPIR